MEYRFIACVIVLLFTVSCSSTADIKKRADNHYKAAAYLDSIGQSDIAKEEYREARKEQKLSKQIIPLLIDLFNHL